jgi:uncharacterized damage-inducible protein DinB
MRRPNDGVRDHVVRVFDWEDAHVGFEAAVAGLASELRGTCPLGFGHSAWQLVEHIRLAQEDILDFCINTSYVHTAPPNDATWEASVAAVLASRARLQQLAREVDDLTVPVPTGTADQTYLRAILLAADHVAYHVGQFVALRKALGAWR